MFEKLKLPIAVFLLALAVRGVACYLRFDRLSDDPDAYARIAETISKTGVYGLTSTVGRPVPTAFRPPLYPYSLSWLVSGGSLSRFGVAALHTVLGAITVLLVLSICRRLLGPERAGLSSLLAAVLVAIDPILVQQSTLIMTETLATALATLVIWCWIRCREHNLRMSTASVAWVIALGVLLSLAYLCRPTFLVWALLLCGSAVLLPVGVWQRRLGLAALMLLPLVVSVAAWTQRNGRVMGHPIWATTHGGYTLLLGNNPLFYDYLREGEWGEIWDAGPFLTAYQRRHLGNPSTDRFWRTDWSTIPTRSSRRGTKITEYEDDRICYDAARATIDREPGTFLWSCLVRLGRLWSPFPHRTAGRSQLQVTVVGIYYVVFYAAVLCGLWRGGRAIGSSSWWPIWLLVITLSLVHAIYWSNLRMRAPIMPALAVVAAAAIAPRREQELDG